MTVGVPDCTYIITYPTEQQAINFDGNVQTIRNEEERRCPRTILHRFPIIFTSFTVPQTWPTRGHLNHHYLFSFPSYAHILQFVVEDLKLKIIAMFWKWTGFGLGDRGASSRVAE